MLIKTIILSWTQLIVLLIFVNGSLIAQGLTLNRLPALLNDSIVGITIPQMDFLMNYKFDCESTFNVLMVYKNYYEDCSIQSEARLKELLAQRHINELLSSQSVLNAKDIYNCQADLTYTKKQIKKAQFNTTLAWVATTFIATAGTFLYISK